MKRGPSGVKMRNTPSSSLSIHIPGLPDFRIDYNYWPEHFEGRNYCTAESAWEAKSCGIALLRGLNHLSPGRAGPPRTLARYEDMKSRLKWSAVPELGSYFHICRNNSPRITILR